MYTFEILDNGDNKVKLVDLSALKEATAAEWFVFTAAWFVDIMNGGKLSSETLDKFEYKDVNDYKSYAALSMLHILTKHSYFEAAKNDIDNVNHEPLKKLNEEVSSLKTNEINETPSYVTFLKLVQDLKIPGIASIKITNEEKTNDSDGVNNRSRMFKASSNKQDHKPTSDNNSGYQFAISVAVGTAMGLLPKLFDNSILNVGSKLSIGILVANVLVDKCSEYLDSTEVNQLSFK